MSLPSTLTIPAEVMARQVGDEIVILDLASGSYYGLDAVGARAWQLLSEGRKPLEVCDSLLAEFEVTREQLERDLEHLFSELVSKGLATIGG